MRTDIVDKRTFQAGDVLVVNEKQLAYKHEYEYCYGQPGSIAICESNVIVDGLLQVHLLAEDPPSKVLFILHCLMESWRFDKLLNSDITLESLETITGL